MNSSKRPQLSRRHRVEMLEHIAHKDDDGRAVVSIKVLSCPMMYVEDYHGHGALRRIAEQAGLTVDQLKGGTAWITPGNLARFFEGVRSLVSDDEAFKSACVHRLRDAWGAFAYVTLAGTPVMVMKACARTTHLLAKMSRVEVLEEGFNNITLRYTSTTRGLETRLLCMSRQATTAAMPTLFGLPRAMVKEHSCIAHGDDACEYEFSFYTRATWWLATFGALLGFLGAYMLSKYTAVGLGGWVGIPISGFLIGALIELRRTYAANVAFGEQMQTALRAVAEGEGEARREIMALHQRDKNWAKLMEEQVDERTQTLHRVLGQLQSMAEQQVTHMRGFSHDLRNPLAVLSANSQYLRSAMRRLAARYSGDEDAVPETIETLRAHFDDALDDNDQAIGSMERMLSALLDTLVVGKGELVQLEPEELEIATLADSLQRRVRALVYGRDIRVSVFMTREAPERLLTDPLIFERVVDNLCTNAAKYTARGSIVIELDGNPDFFILQVSDTGRGIPSDMMDKVMMPQGSDASSRADNSYGIGLSVTIQLLEQIGGRLEVDSTVGVGTTFWAYFPRSKPMPVPNNVIDIRRAQNK